MIKACGVAEFTGDIQVAGGAEPAFIHSLHAHALIKSIDTSAAEKMSGVIGVMRAEDIKGTNRLKYNVADRPILCDTEVRFIGDPVAAVLAETRELVVAAAIFIERKNSLLLCSSSPLIT
jgi:aldehyde oxidoreductase